MRKFTDKELELAPKVAEILGFKLTIEKGNSRLEYKDGKRVENTVIVPLEYDCLEWLQGKILEWFCLEYNGEKDWEFQYWDYEGETRVAYGQTALEVLYRCIIEIGKGGKNA